MRARLFLGLATLVLPLAIAQSATATAPTTGSGTFALAPTSVATRTAGDNIIIVETDAGSFTGTISGTITENIRIVVHTDDGSAEFHGIDTCAPCTVAGKTGGYSDVFSGTQAPSGNFVGHFAFGGTGALATLHGVGTFKGLAGAGT